MGLSTWLHWLYGIVFIAHRGHGFHRITLIYYRFLWMTFNGITQTSLDDPIGYHPWRQVFATVLLESNQKTRLKSRLSSCWLFIFSTRWHWFYGIIFIAHRRHGINERKGENGKRKTGLSHTESTENTEFHCFILIPTERLDSCVCPYIENCKFICICL